MALSHIRLIAVTGLLTLGLIPGGATSGPVQRHGIMIAPSPVSRQPGTALTATHYGTLLTDGWYFGRLAKRAVANWSARNLWDDFVRPIRSDVFGIVADEHDWDPHAASCSVSLQWLDVPRHCQAGTVVGNAQSAEPAGISAHDRIGLSACQPGAEANCAVGL